jgi:hypothetical protein
LPLSNPFFQPYAKEWKIDNNFTFTKTNFSTQIPNQIVNYSNSYPPSPPYSSQSLAEFTSQSSQDNLVWSPLVKFAIVDRLNLGISANCYLVSSKPQRQPFPPFGFRQQYGFSEPTFSLTGRLAGINKNETYVDAYFAFTPAFNTDSATSAFNQRFIYTGGLAVGRQYKILTFGILAGYVYKTAKTANPDDYPINRIVTGGLLAQVDFDRFFIRGFFHVVKNVDSTSNSDPILRQIMPVARIQPGVASKSGNQVLFLSFAYAFPVSGTYSGLAGFFDSAGARNLGYFQYTTTYGGNWSVSIEASFRL